MKDYLSALLLLLRALFVSRLGRVAIATEALLILNIAARGMRRYDDRYDNLQDWIYALKSRLLRLLYEGGYCTEVGQTVQTLECWGTNRYDCGPHCPKCGGTGIYREFVLIDFTFHVNGRRYRWHQPRELVDWPVTLTGEALGEYAWPNTPRPDLPHKELELLSLVVWWALALRRRAPALPFLRFFRLERWRHDKQTLGTYGRGSRGFRWLGIESEWGPNGWKFEFPCFPQWQLRHPHGLGARHLRWLCIYRRKDRSDPWEICIMRCWIMRWLDPATLRHWLRWQWLYRADPRRAQDYVNTLKGYYIARINRLNERLPRPLKVTVERTYERND